MKFSEITSTIAKKAINDSRLFSKLIKENDLFIEKIIQYSRTANHFPDYLEKEDIKQELYLSLLKGLKAYSGEKNTKFSTFMWIVFKNDLNQLKHKGMKVKIHEKKASKINKIPEISDDLQILDSISSKKGLDNKVETEIINKILLDSAYNDLDTLNQKIFDLKIKGKKSKEIAQELNLNINTYKFIYRNSFLVQMRKKLSK